MYRDQLFCILAPPADQPLACIESAVGRSRGQLTAALAGVGCIHYASLFVLPPRPATDGSTRKVIVALELAVDRIRTRADRDDLLHRLVVAGLDALWPVFALHSDLQDDAPTSDRSRWLTDFFIRHIRPADGGFVGSRDITVDDVHKEAALYGALRAEANVLAKVGLDRDALALRLAAAPAASCVQPGLNAAQSAAMALQSAMAEQRDAKFPWAVDEAAHQKPWCSPHLDQIRRAGLISLRSLRGAWLPVIAVILGSLFAVIGAFVAVAAVLILRSEPVWASLTLYGSSPYGVTLTLAILWFGGAFATWLGVYLWLEGVTSTVVISFVIPGLLLFIAITFVVVGQVIGGVAGWLVYPVPPTLSADAHPFGGVPLLGDVLSVSVLLAGWGVSWIAGAIFLAVILLVAFIGALICVSPDRGSRAVGWTTGAFFVLLFVLGHAVLWFAVQVQPTAGWIGQVLAFLKIDPQLLEYQAGDWPWIDKHLLALFRLDGMFLLALAIMMVVTALVYFAIRLALRLNLKRSARITSDRQAIVVERAQQVHESVVACEASLSNRCNHMISLTELRPSVPWRRITTLLALRTIGRLADTWFVRGLLGYATGIHYAHWYLVDEGRRLLFLSNYDGDFSGYLDEFIRGAAEGVNLIWQGSRLLPRAAAGPGHPAVLHPRDFPTVRRFVLHGCEHEQWFKAYVRDSMLPHLFRFEAYDKSLQNILAARRLRNARVGERTPIKDDIMLRSLER